MDRVGILGGTFDPPHNAHLRMARAALERIPLDRVLLMPAPHPPHKQAGDVTPYAVRLRMVELAVCGEPGIEVSRMEEGRGGPSYTIDLLDVYRRDHDDDVFLIVGADSVQDLPDWKSPRSILKLATLVVFPRTGYEPAVPVEGKAAVVLFEEPVIDISSSELRKRVREGKPVESFLHKSVHKFILDNSLYS
ncbi:MAG: nicotinate-nucleotide adenylyltransferase [Candidatus Krumholzibacteriia bacterium]